MADIPFTKGMGLNKRIFRRRSVLKSAANARKSVAYKSLMENKTVARVVNRRDEKKAFYGALQTEGLASGGRGITKKVLKKVLGRLAVENHKEFSRHEMQELGEAIIGGSASSRFIRPKEQTKSAESNSGHSATSPSNSQPRAVVDMNQIKAEILAKSAASRANLAQTNQTTALPYLKLMRKDAMLKEAQAKNFAQAQNGSSDSEKNENYGVVPKYLESVYHDRNKQQANKDEIKSRLVSLQGNNDEDNAESENDLQRLAA
ncbi:MAG: hypothetical protein WCJ51_01055 [Candidatus Moraniibacteriota bacterium]